MTRNRREERRRAEEEASRRPRLGPREARALFKAVTDHRIRRWRFFEDALAPAMPAWSSFAREYARYRRFASAPAIAPGSDLVSDLWTFYALSRVFERLVVGFQDRAGLQLPPNWPGRGSRIVPSPECPRVGPSRDELVCFFGAFGMAPMRVQPRYHPFFHEVAAVELDPALGDAVFVEEEVWPGLWFGDLVFARAGVRVRCGPEAPFDPSLAARSTLYFAWLRVHRPTYDLSHGWGSGSQWGTDFRRDYVDGPVLRYNVDGRVRLTGDAVVTPPDSDDPSGRDPGGRSSLTPAGRVELLTHRCCVRSADPGYDHWPFDDTYTGPDWIW